MYSEGARWQPCATRVRRRWRGPWKVKALPHGHRHAPRSPRRLPPPAPTSGTKRLQGIVLPKRSIPRPRPEIAQPSTKKRGPENDCEPAGRRLLNPRTHSVLASAMPLRRRIRSSPTRLGTSARYPLFCPPQLRTSGSGTRGHGSNIATAAQPILGAEPAARTDNVQVMHLQCRHTHAHLTSSRGRRISASVKGGGSALLQCRKSLGQTHVVRAAGAVAPA